MMIRLTTIKLAIVAILLASSFRTGEAGITVGGHAPKHQHREKHFCHDGYICWGDAVHPGSVPPEDPEYGNFAATIIDQHHMHVVFHCDLGVLDVPNTPFPVDTLIPLPADMASALGYASVIIAPGNYAVDVSNTPEGEATFDVLLGAVTSITVGNIETDARHGIVVLRWSIFADGPAHFQVLRSNQRDGGYAAVTENIDGTGRHEFSIADRSVRPATEYFYKVAYKESRDWSYTQVVRVVTPGAVLALKAALPNPTRGITAFGYEIAHRGQVQIDIFNMNGQRVRSLLNREVAPGVGSASWDGRGEDGRALSAGTYFARLSSDGRVLSQKFMLLR